MVKLQLSKYMRCSVYESFRNTPEVEIYLHLENELVYVLIFICEIFGSVSWPIKSGVKIFRVRGGLKILKSEFCPMNE